MGDVYSRHACLPVSSSRRLSLSGRCAPWPDDLRAQRAATILTRVIRAVARPARLRPGQAR